MKKLFNSIGIICLVIISFVYTEKTVMVVREYDDIMIKIKEKNNSQKIEGLIKKDEIIPCILEKKVNINESYKKMKQKGFYNDELLVYEKIDSKCSLKNNFDKYIIGGNKKKNMVSLIFIVDNFDIEKLVKIINKNNIKVSFVINESWIENNNNLMLKLNKLNHKFLIKNPNKHINSVMKNILKQDIFCYTQYKNKKKLEKCMNEKFNTIMSIPISNNYLYETRKKLESGSIISYNVNNDLIYNLEYIINYIKNKGFVITDIIEHLEE